MLFDINDIKKLAKADKIQWSGHILKRMQQRGIAEGKGLYVVCAIGDDNIWMITAYYPDENEWLDDLRTRR